MSPSAQASRDVENVTPLDETDRRLLTLIHSEFPLCRHPYREVARQAGLSEEQALERVRALRERGIIRRIGGVLNSGRLGLTGTLVALKVPADRIEEVAAAINAVPNVTHNYLRDHDYNMWFTVTAGSREELTHVVNHIRQSTGIGEMLDLPSLKTFKVGVKLDFNATCSGN